MVGLAGGREGQGGTAAVRAANGSGRMDLRVDPPEWEAREEETMCRVGPRGTRRVKALKALRIVAMETSVS